MEFVCFLFVQASAIPVAVGAHCAGCGARCQSGTETQETHGLLAADV
jgi:hypothetical protein